MANITSLAKGGSATLVKRGRVQHEISLAEAVTAGLATTEYVKIIDIPAGTHVKINRIRKDTTLGGTTLTVSAGDSSAVDVFVAASTATTSGDLTLTTTPAGVGGKVYATADTLRFYVTCATIANVTGDIQFDVTLTDVNYKEPATVGTF